MTHRDRPRDPSDGVGRPCRWATSPAPHTPSRKPWQAVPMSHYQRTLVLDHD